MLGPELGVDTQSGMRKARGTAPATTWPVPVVAGVSAWGKLVAGEKTRKVKGSGSVKRTGGESRSAQLTAEL